MMLTSSWRPIKPGLLLKGFLGISGLVAGACLVHSQAANAYAHNLVTNGTFDTSLHGWNIITIPEIGRFSWDVFGNPTGSARGDKVSGPGSALYSRILGQSISTIAGEEYAIAFQLYNPNPGLGVVEASFGTNSMSATGSLLPEWKTYSFEGKAAGAKTLLTFSYADLYHSIFIDHVSVRVKARSDVPSPLPLLGLGAAFGYRRRLRKRINVSKKANGRSRTG